MSNIYRSMDWERDQYGSEDEYQPKGLGGVDNDEAEGGGDDQQNGEDNEEERDIEIEGYGEDFNDEVEGGGDEDYNAKVSFRDRERVQTVSEDALGGKYVSQLSSAELFDLNYKKVNESVIKAICEHLKIKRTELPDPSKIPNRDLREPLATALAIHLHLVVTASEDKIDLKDAISDVYKATLSNSTFTMPSKFATTDRFNYPTPYDLLRYYRWYSSTLSEQRR